MLTPKYDPSIFRHDAELIIARNMQRASIVGINLGYDSGGYVAGQTLAFNTTSLLYQKYVNGGSSGLGSALCFLLDNPPSDNTTASGNCQLRGLFAGEVFKAALTGLDSTAETSLGGHEYVDFTGVTIFTF